MPTAGAMWSPTALSHSAEVASATKAGEPWRLHMTSAQPAEAYPPSPQPPPRLPPAEAMRRAGRWAAEASAKAARLRRVTRLAFIHGFTPVAVCEGGYSTSLRPRTSAVPDSASQHPSPCGATSSMLRFVTVFQHRGTVDDAWSAARENL